MLTNLKQMNKKYFNKQMLIKIRNKITGSLHLGRREYEGAIVLLVILILLFVLRLFLVEREASQTLTQTEEQEVETFLEQRKHRNDSIMSARNNRSSSTNNSYNQKRKLTPFPFDPNTMTFSEWKRLGLTEQQAQQIINYQSKGGYFRYKTDLEKIYSITKEDYQTLEPYIQLASKQEYKTKENYETKERYKTEERKIHKVELNEINDIELQKIPGIGQKTASYIVKYRERLGGFININQLTEVYRMDSSRYLQISSYLYVNPDNIKKININKAEVQELTKHPYIDFYIAKSIVVHRKNYGDYGKAEDIKQAIFLYEELYQKIIPYLSVE
jgi:competence ComEA-like helix-hairpin-helix protein